MKERAAERAAELIRGQRVAALGTTHEGAASVTMAPYALIVEPFAIVVLVSALASHTRDMRDEPRVSILVMEPESKDLSVHALARISLHGEARALPPGDALHPVARRAYAARFPDMIGLFDLADFTLFAIVPSAVRVVSGFAQAASITPRSLADAVRADSSTEGGP